MLGGQENCPGGGICPTRMTKNRYYTICVANKIHNCPIYCLNHLLGSHFVDGIFRCSQKPDEH